MNRSEKKIILTGDRPTGKLHLGHYAGTLNRRIALQKEYKSYFIIADLHKLTTKNSRHDIEKISEQAKQLVLDSLAAGIKPENAVFYLQSALPEVHEIYTLLQNLVSVSRLERLPGLKDMARSAKMEMSFGLLGYPVLQTADIIGVKAHLVPVGEDNRAHVEIAREITRRFNNKYGDFFPVPRAEVGQEKTLVGIYGEKKMSKSADNAIFLSDNKESVKEKVMQMKTDEKRISPDIPGTVEGNPVFIYHDLFNDNKKEVENLKNRYRNGNVGDVEVKEKLAQAINKFLRPIQKRRKKFSDSNTPENLLAEGTQKTRSRVKTTLKGMKRKMGLAQIKKQLRIPEFD